MKLCVYARTICGGFMHCNTVDDGKEQKKNHKVTKKDEILVELPKCRSKLYQSILQILTKM